MNKFKFILGDDPIIKFPLMPMGDQISSVINDLISLPSLNNDENNIFLFLHIYDETSDKIKVCLSDVKYIRNCERPIVWFKSGSDSSNSEMYKKTHWQKMLSMLHMIKKYGACVDYRGNWYFIRNIDFYCPVSTKTVEINFIAGNKHPKTNLVDLLGLSSNSVQILSLAPSLL